MQRKLFGGHADADGICDAIEGTSFVTGPISDHEIWTAFGRSEYAKYKAAYFVYFEAENRGDVLSTEFADDTVDSRETRVTTGIDFSM